jgi:hypothetical protein
LGVERTLILAAPSSTSDPKPTLGLARQQPDML